MIDVWLAGACLVAALIPGLLFARNLRLYRPAPMPADAGKRPAISVLIPARNEETSIRGAVEAAAASQGVEWEVIVLDDHSEDQTAAIGRELAARDARIRLEPAPPLPADWCGKQHACHVLAGHASYPLLAFLDADVRLEPLGLARAAAFLEQSDADLVSGVPRQVTRTLAERMVIPLIHFILLGFLPIGRMRASRHPAYGAGCGQFFLVRRNAYQQSGGHAAIRHTLHDGLLLPRALRAAGRRTDLVDATDLASCRMYPSFGALWQGLAKNAMEGLAAPKTIGPATLVLVAGQVLPLPLLLAGLVGLLSPLALLIAGLATTACYYPRLAAAVRFRQSLVGALLHPVGMVLFLAIQWYALVGWLRGRAPGWKGRTYVPVQEEVSP